MSKRKIAVSLGHEVLQRQDVLVKKHLFPSRSSVIQEAVKEKLQRINQGRLARECAKLDQAFEKALAEESFCGGVGEWPEY